MQMYNECGSPSSMTARPKPRSSRCCFRTYPMETVDDRARTPRSPYWWLKSTAHELEIKDKCRSLIARIGAKGGRRLHSHGSVDFSYDPMSYALNFEDDRFDDESPPSFSSRLPATPER